MAILNPVYGIIIPFLFVVTTPLAILAGITTTLAFSVLMFRVALVYVDIGMNMAAQYVAGRPIHPLFRSHAEAGAISSAAPATSNAPSSPVSGGGASGHSSPTTSRQAAAVARHHRRRRASAASFNSFESITPTADDNNNNNNHSHSGTGLAGGGSKRNSFVMMPSSVGMDRDFEGVGGWRLNGRGSAASAAAADDDDDAWTHINSRLSLPLDHHWRQHHHRSPSGAGTATPGGNGGDGLMMRSSSALLISEDRLSEHSGKRGAKAGAVVGVSPTSSTKALPPLTMADGSDASYFPRNVSPRAEKRPV